MGYHETNPDQHDDFIEGLTLGYDDGDIRGVLADLAMAEVIELHPLPDNIILLPKQTTTSKDMKKGEW